MSDPGEAEALESLLFECLEQMELRGLKAFEAFCAEHPGHESALRDSIGALLGAGLVTLPPSESSERPFPERLGEFRLLRRIGGGGMGVVFLAEQATLGRDVALKLIRPDQLYFPHARERFQREIEAIARLQHPGIVQVHSVGEDKGIPFFAMEHVPGTTLAEVLAALNGQSPEELTARDLARAIEERASGRARGGAATPLESESAASFQGTWTEVATRLALAIARAVQHAHERGVLHRDLKPSNVMLTPSGRVVLLDFGLASVMGASRLTHTGSQLGSLPYMAPEQIRGDIDAIGVPTDVYAVGVTLYELLTLRPAFEDGSNSEALRQRILEGRTSRPQRFHRGVTRDLGTVLRLAMAPEATARYPSARALADDLDAVLASRPIAAHLPSAFHRARAWTRRNPARATATVLAAILVLGGPTAFGWQQYRAGQRASALNADLHGALDAVRTESALKEVQRLAAERNLRKAIEAVDTMLTKVGAESLRNVPQMTGVRRELLEAALNFYEGFLAEAGSDVELRREVSLARLRVASVRAMLGETADVERALTTVIKEMRALVDDPATRTRVIPELARALGTHGEASARLGRPDAARASVTEAIAMLEGLTQDARDAATMTLLAALHDRLYDVEERSGDLPSALASAERAVAVSRAALARWPEYTPLVLGLGRQLDHAGGALLRSGDAERSRTYLLEAVATLERYRAARPDDVQGREKLLAARVNAANTLYSLQRLDEAEASTRAAIELGAVLVVEFPEVQSYRTAYAIALNQSCAYAFQRGDLVTAEATLERALAQQEQVAKSRVGDYGFFAELSSSYGNLGYVQLQLGKAELGLANIDRGLAHLAKSLEVAPRHDPWLSMRRALVGNRGMCLVALARWQEAAAAARAIERDQGPTWLVRRAQLLERSARLAAVAGTLQGTPREAPGEPPEEALSDDARAAEAEALRAEALADLALAVEQGHSDWSELADPDEWTSLRDAPEFQALVARSKGDE